MKQATILVSLLVLLCSAAGQRPSLDGMWWKSLSGGEQTEFLAGYIDCYANDFGDKNNTFPESWYTYAPRITQYYEQRPDKRKRSVTGVLFDVRSKNPPKPAQGGEVWTEKHWFFNGEYWVQMGSTQQVAFVEGYLACYREHLSSRPQRFSKPAAFYAERISHWYDAKTVQLSSKREHTAIADALIKFADKK